MLLFCPSCSNLLVVSRISNTQGAEKELEGKNRFECRTCPYQYVIDKQYYDRKLLKRKDVDDVVGGKSMWENVDQVEVNCVNEKCDSGKAFWYALQIRSADEPMTNFYKCIKCAKEWRE